MAAETPKDEPAPVPAQSDGDAKGSTAEVEAEVAADEPLAEPNKVLDALVARDAALAVPVSPPSVVTASRPRSAATEWGAAIVLMILFAFICVAFMSFFRG